MSGKQNRIMGIMGTDPNFPNHWNNFFQSLEKYGKFFPIVGKSEKKGDRPRISSTRLEAASPKLGDRRAA